MAQKSKLWRYEADCKRTEELVKVTVENGGRPGWGTCVDKILFTLRMTRPRATPLALHFISLSAKEMLAKRHDNARLMLLTAFAIANKHMMESLQMTFKKAFAGPTPQQFLAAVSAVLGKIQQDIEKLPEGMSAVQVGPLKVDVIKKTLGSPSKNPFFGNPRLN